MKIYIKSSSDREKAETNYYAMFHDATNPNTPADRLESIYRYGLSENPYNLPMDTIKYHISKHKNTPKALRDEILRDPAVQVNGRVVQARNTNSPEELAKLAYDESAEVRKTVADNKYTPDDIVELLKDDPDYGVRSAVEFRLSDPKGWAKWR